jgi:ATP-dependent Zn protease
MRTTLEQAKQRAPAIVFIDEVDSFPNRATLRHDWSDWEVQVVNGSLAEIDGVDGREGVVLVAACNFPHLLDPALVRSGRLDRHIRIKLPDVTALELILREHLNDDIAGEDLVGAAIAAAGSSGVDCERYARGARRRAREAGRSMVLAALMAQISGNDERATADLRISAVHDSGQAVAEFVSNGAINGVSLRMADGSSGSMSSPPKGLFLKAGDVRRRLLSTLAGRAAEEIILGEPSSGAGGGSTSDLAQATRLAVIAATSLGFNDDEGLVWSGLPNPSDLERRLVTDLTLAARVRSVLSDAYGDACALIQRRRQAVEALAEALLAERALSGDAAAAIVGRHPETRNTTGRSS